MSESRRKQPHSWEDRFRNSLALQSSPHLDEWRWAKANEEPCNPLAIEAAWDIMTQHVSAEANWINHAIHLMEGELQRVMLSALIVAGSRETEIGAFEFTTAKGKTWRPRNLPFVPGGEPVPVVLSIQCSVSIKRSVTDFLVSYHHTDIGQGTEVAFVPKRGTATVAVLCGEHGEGSPIPEEKQRSKQRDLELREEGHHVIRYRRAEIWQDSIACALAAIRTAKTSAIEAAV